MERNLYQQLVAWKNDPDRKPLLLRGARQVGKTYLLESFGKNEYANMIYLDFDADPNLNDLFKQNLDPMRIIRDLSLKFNEKIEPGKTLLIFDEIQESPLALNSLKYFNEKANQFHVVAAGSLLGVKLANNKGFPVGKVTFLDLKPLNFYEFLIAIKKNLLADELLNKKDTEPLSSLIHEQLIELLRIYTIVGGMPEAIKTYIKDPTHFAAVRKVQKDILDAYELDVAKHAEPHDVVKILNVWHSIPSQLAKENKKFMFSKLGKNARTRDYESAIQWLEQAGMILRSHQLTTIKFPLDGHLEDAAYKVFLLDVGLLGCMSRLPPQILLEGNRLFIEFKGSFTENFIAEELCTQEFPLYYWTQGQVAEVDFILPIYTDFIPMEVKAGKDKGVKSLKIFQEKFSPPKILRTSLLNYAKTGSLLNLPLYAAFTVNNFC